LSHIKTAAQLLSDLRPRVITADELLVKVKDATGHEHGSDGRFGTSSTGTKNYPTPHENAARYIAEQDHKNGGKREMIHLHGEVQRRAGPYPKFVRTKRRTQAEAAYHETHARKDAESVAKRKRKPRVKKIRDASGHEHSESDGKFTGPGGGGSAAAKPTKEKPAHAKVKGQFRADDGKASSQAPARGVTAEKIRKHLILVLGGPGSGKGAIRKAYEGYLEGLQSVDPDALKMANPLYSHRNGWKPGSTKKDFTEAEDATHFGPSGPRSADDLAKYSPEDQEAVEKFIREKTPFKSSKEFAQKFLHDPTGKYFGGGLTHELSSYMATAKMDQLLDEDDGQHRNILYDAVGNEAKYKDWAERALANGHAVTFHHVRVPTHVAQMRNSTRERTVDPAIVSAGHKKAGATAAGLEAYTRDLRREHLPVNFASSYATNKQQAKDAADQGWTDHGMRQES